MAACCFTGRSINWLCSIKKRWKDFSYLFRQWKTERFFVFEFSTPLRWHYLRATPVVVCYKYIYSIQHNFTLFHNQNYIILMQSIISIKQKIVEENYLIPVVMVLYHFVFFFVHNLLRFCNPLFHFADSSNKRLLGSRKTSMLVYLFWPKIAEMAENLKFFC